MTLPNFDDIFPVQNIFFRNFLKLSYKKESKCVVIFLFLMMFYDYKEKEYFEYYRKIAYYFKLFMMREWKMKAQWNFSVFSSDLKFEAVKLVSRT